MTVTVDERTRRDRPRRVLMIAAAFPPMGGSGVQRTVKFAKYLPRNGWLPTVWAAEPPDDAPLDPTLLDDLPDEVVVHRRPADGLVRSARRVVRRMARAQGITARLGAAVDWRLARWESQRPLPDSLIPWARNSVTPLARIIERERIDALYSTFSPASNHWLALRLKRLTGLPWVADFRDLWTDDYRYVEPSAGRRRAHRTLEQEVLQEADAVIGVTPRQTKVLAAHLPQEADKFVTITNGFDPDDYESDVPAGEKTQRDRFVLAHVGRFDRWRTGEAWFAGLRRLADTLGDKRERFLLRIVGHAAGDTLARLSAAGIPFEFTGYVSHRDAVHEMRRADALLLNVPDGPNAKTVLPAKVFEYLAARRPIVLVGPVGGACEPLLRRHRAGWCVGFDSLRIANVLETVFCKWRRGRLTGIELPPETLEPYSRATLTARLAGVLDAVTTGDRPVEGRKRRSAEVLVP